MEKPPPPLNLKKPPNAAAQVAKVLDSQPPPATPSLQNGIDVIKEAARHLTHGPGVYRMINVKGKVLYVGKAINLKKRVTSYTRPQCLPIRLQRMISETARMEFLLTANEVEALLLENNLIKSYRPPYNVLLRDDKTYLEILIRSDHDYPQITKHRGSHKQKGDYFGPYASAASVYETMNLIERVFLLRNCSDSIFSNRKRPCLQYQIKRCSAPCVGLISQQDYKAQLNGARAYLRGEDSGLLNDLESEMAKAAADRHYERAAILRDRMRALSQLSQLKAIHNQALTNADLFILAEAGGKRAVQSIFYRGGRYNGAQIHWPQQGSEMKDGEFMAAFLGQFYQNITPPREILVNIAPIETELLEQALSSLTAAEGASGYKVKILNPKRGEKYNLIRHGEQNAAEALSRELSARTSQKQMLSALQDLLDLPAPLQRVEVYDNSHLSGKNPIGAMIVVGPDGFQKTAYRTFNIRGIKGSEASPPSEETSPPTEEATPPSEETALLTPYETADDYAMMREVMIRRFRRAMKAQEDQLDDDLGEDEGGDSPSSTAAQSWPDLVILDGGPGQLSMARQAFDELGILDQVNIIAISKGPDRHAGREKLYLPNVHQPLELDRRDPLLYFLQRIRDEAHRFAIGTQRNRRKKQNFASPLDEIDGIGAKRKRQILLYFGSARAVSGAGIDDLMRMPGISKAMATRIYNHFHPE